VIAEDLQTFHFHFFRDARAEAADFDAGIGNGSPRGILDKPGMFLFRVERISRDCRSNQNHRNQPTAELASRLSFFLWKQHPG
jgi:hypothetical protein